MKTGYVGVLDSGIGGLTVLKRLTSTFRNQHFIYLGDNINAPYGNKTQRELLALAVENVSLLLSYGVTAVVIACNTLSLTVLPQLKRIFNIPIFGIYPPTETCSLQNKNTLLLSTVRTAEYFKCLNNVTTVGLRDLATDIENNVFSLNRVNIKRHLQGIECKYETIILGCTHYPLLKKQIFNHLKPLEILDGVDNTIFQMAKTLRIPKSSVKFKINPVSFIGSTAKYNQKIWELVVKNS